MTPLSFIWKLVFWPATSAIFAILAIRLTHGAVARIATVATAAHLPVELTPDSETSRLLINLRKNHE